MCVQLEGDSPLVEEFELPLWLVVAGRGFWRGTALATTRSSRRLLSLPLPVCGVVFCWVRCLRALFVWCCSLRRVMYECFFLYDAAVLLTLFKKKGNGRNCLPTSAMISAHQSYF